jgi:hypothetical protein
MDPKTVAIKGPGGLYGRIGELGKGLFGWYPIIWDGTSVSDDKYKWTLTKPDNLFEIRPLSDEGCLGLDATSHSTSLEQQFYVKPGHDRGAYESPIIYEGNYIVPLEAVVEYSNDQGKYPSCAFAVEVL